MIKKLLLTTAFLTTMVLGAENEQIETVELLFGNTIVSINLDETRLNIKNKSFTGAIPQEIGQLRNLEELTLCYNQLTDEIPQEIGHLENLDFLQLAYNQLTGEIPTTIGDLTKLRHLNLHHNWLTGEIPTTIGDLTELFQIGLASNRLTGEIPTSLWGMQNLEDLDLSENYVFGRAILNRTQTIHFFNNLFSITASQNPGVCSITVRPHGGHLRSYYDINGVRRDNIVVYDVASFTDLSLAEQARRLEEVANCGIEQTMIFTFPGGRTLTITAGLGTAREIIIPVWCNTLRPLKQALEASSLSLSQFQEAAADGEHPRGLIYIPSQTKRAQSVLLAQPIDQSPQETDLNDLDLISENREDISSDQTSWCVIS